MDQDASYVYVIWSDKLNKMYVGSSSNPQQRLEQHNRGASHFTSRGTPWVLRYSEQYPEKSQAVRREKYLKTGAGRVFLKRVILRTAGYPEAELPAECLAFQRTSS